MAVEDTNEVAEAKANFYTLFKEHEAKVQEALENDEAVAEVVDEAVIDVRKREAEEGYPWNLLDKSSIYIRVLPGKISVSGA